eukprot:1028295-Amphidinium_carterae.1
MTLRQLTPRLSSQTPPGYAARGARGKRVQCLRAGCIAHKQLWRALQIPPQQAPIGHVYFIQ